MKALAERIRGEGKYSLLFKMLIIGVLILLILIPLNMIRALIGERSYTRLNAEDEIIGTWGGEQVIGGPVLTVPYLVRRKDSQGNIQEHTEMAHFLPRELRIEGRVVPELRYRGIYEVTVYQAELRLAGSFGQPDFSEWRIPRQDILWKAAFLALEFPDMRALREGVRLQWEGRHYDFAAGAGEVGIYDGGIRTGLPDLAAGAEDRSYAFSCNLRLRGGRSLSFLPLGDETTVRLSSPWPSPSFSGSFLPDSRSVGSQGFEASWYVLSLGRNYPQQWRSPQLNPASIRASAFGVNLMIPVDTYLKSERSVKYGILFILLPFLTFFLFEVFLRRRIHPFQYLLVGFAETLFYLLLLSISEHLAFPLAYLLAGLATVGLITFYSMAVLAAGRRSLIMAAVLLCAYAFLYALLRSEDYALLIGSLGLFAILAGVMIITRRIDWYRWGAKESPRQKAGEG